MWNKSIYFLQMWRKFRQPEGPETVVYVFFFFIIVGRNVPVSNVPKFFQHGLHKLLYVLSDGNVSDVLQGLLKSEMEI